MMSISSNKNRSDYQKEYRKKNRKRLLELGAEHRKKNKPRTKRYNKTYWIKNGKLLNERNKLRAKKIRQEVLKIYGNKCVCCGESTYEFLCFDHKFNSRKNPAFRGQSGIAYQLKKEGYPDYIQILCYNCNMSKAFHEACPHFKR